MSIHVLPRGVPVASHPYTEEMCDRRVLAYVTEAEAAIMALPPHERRTNFESLSRVLKWFSACEGSWQASETFYTFGQADLPGRPKRAGLEEEAVALRFFRGDLNARAARERARVITNLVANLIWAAPAGRPIRIACVASNSTRAVLSGVRLARRKATIKLIDNNTVSLGYCSRQLMPELGMDDDVDYTLGNIKDLRPSFADGEQVDIAEAAGILDYFDDEQVTRLPVQIREHMREGAVLIASNIMENPARGFLHSAVGWRPMYYRSMGQFVVLFTTAGFAPDELRVHVTPTKDVYVIVEAVRDPTD
jgi:hypothetical protein